MRNMLLGPIEKRTLPLIYMIGMPKIIVKQGIGYWKIVFFNLDTSGQVHTSLRLHPRMFSSKIHSLLVQCFFDYWNLTTLDFTLLVVEEHMLSFVNEINIQEEPTDLNPTLK